eukprot:scaffold17798_cov198-Skeletonema_dohrnii-CCMP3373.AAC.1
MIWWAGREAFVTERGLSRGAKKDRLSRPMHDQPRRQALEDFNRIHGGIPTFLGAMALLLLLLSLPSSDKDS